MGSIFFLGDGFAAHDIKLCVSGREIKLFRP
jgi:hypothetical protein